MYEFLLVGGVVLWIAMAVIYARSGLASVFHPATYYMFFHGFIFVIRPIIAWIGDYRLIYKLYDFRPMMDVKITSLLVADLGFVCFMAVLLRVGRAPLTLRPTVGQRVDDQHRFRSSLLIASAILMPIGIYSLRFVLSAGDNEVAGMTMDAATGAYISDTGNGYIFSASNMIGALSVLLAWQFRFRLLSLAPFLMYVVARVAVGGSRWTFVLTSAALALLWLYDRGRRWPSVPILVGAAALLFGFTLVGQQRDILKSYFTGQGISQDVFKERLLEGMDFANLEYLEYQVYAIPDKTGTWGYFTDNAQVLTEPIPRVLWRAKPIGSPIKMWDLWQYGSPLGITFSLPGTGWDQLGYPGVVIWCSLWGWLFGLFYNWFARSRQTGFNVGLYLLLLPMTVQFARDGVLLSALKFPMWHIVSVLVWWAAAKLFGGAKTVRPSGAYPQRRRWIAGLQR